MGPDGLPSSADSWRLW